MQFKRKTNYVAIIIDFFPKKEKKKKKKKKKKLFRFCMGICRQDEIFSVFRFAFWFVYRALRRDGIYGVVYIFE